MKNLPDKLYILYHEDYSDRRIFNAFTEKESNTDIEYIRKDAFIEEVCEWLNKELPITDLSPSNMLDITFKVFDKECKRMFIEDFKKYIKGK